MKSKIINCLITFSNVEVTFTLEEWRAYNNNEITSLEVILGHSCNVDVIKYKKYMTFAVTMAVSFVLMTLEANASTFKGIETIDNLGATFVGIIQQAGYWICFAKGLVDIIKELLKGGDKADSIGRILFKYVLAFASFYLLPFLFNIIKENFS